MTSNELILAKHSVKLVLNIVDLYFTNHTYSDAYKATDLHYLTMVLKGLLNNLEAAHVDDILRILTYTSSCIFAHTHNVYSLDPQFYDYFFDAMSRVLAKIHFDHNLIKRGLMHADQSYQLRVNLVLTQVRSCINEFTRILLLKMNQNTLFEYSYPFDKVTGYNSELIQD